MKTTNLRTEQLCFFPVSMLGKEKKTDKTKGKLPSNPKFETPLPSDRLCLMLEKLPVWNGYSVFDSFHIFLYLSLKHLILPAVD